MKKSWIPDQNQTVSKKILTFYYNFIFDKLILYVKQLILGQVVVIQRLGASKYRISTENCRKT